MHLYYFILKIGRRKNQSLVISGTEYWRSWGFIDTYFLLIV